MDYQQKKLMAHVQQNTKLQCCPQERVQGGRAFELHVGNGLHHLFPQKQ